HDNAHAVTAGRARNGGFDWRFGHLTDEAVALPGHGNDHGLPAVPISQGLSKQEHHLRQIAFLDYRVTPNGLQQVVLGDRDSWTLQENEQDVKSTTRDLDHLVAAKEYTAAEVGPERSELQEVLCFHLRRPHLRISDQN